MKKYVSLLLAAALSVAGLGLISAPAHAADGAVITVERVGTSVRFDLRGGPANERLLYIATVWGDQTGGNDLATDHEGSASITIPLPAKPTSSMITMSAGRVSTFEQIATVSMTLDPSEVTFTELTVKQRVDRERQFVVTGAEPGEVVTYRITATRHGAEPVVRTARADDSGRAVLLFESFEPVTVTATGSAGMGGPVLLSMGTGNPVTAANEYASRGKKCTTSAYKARGFVYPGGVVTGLPAGQVLPLVEQAYGEARVIATVEADQNGRAVIPAHTLTRVSTGGRWVDGYTSTRVKMWEADRRDPVLTLGSVTLVRPSARILTATGYGLVRCEPPTLRLKPKASVRSLRAGLLEVTAWAWRRTEHGYAAGPASGTITVKNAKGERVASTRTARDSNMTPIKVKRPAAGTAASYRVIVKIGSATVTKTVRVAGIPKVTAKVKGKRVVSKIRYANGPLVKGSRVAVKVGKQKAKTVTVRKAGVVSVKTHVKGKKKKVRFVIRDAKGKHLGSVVKVVKK